MSEMMRMDALRNVAFLNGATRTELDQLVEYSEILVLKKFEILYRKGDITDAVFHVHSGMMKVSTVVNQGKEVIRAIAHPGMLLGEGVLSGVSRQTATSQSLDRQTKILEIKAVALRRLMMTNAEVAVSYMDYIALKLQKSARRLESVIAEDARTRVIKFLMENANKYGNKVGYNELLLKHNFTQQDIADFTGTSRQTVTTILNDLKRSNLIAMNRRRILIRNVKEMAS